MSCVFLVADRQKPDRAFGPFWVLVQRATFRTNFVPGKVTVVGESLGSPVLGMGQKIGNWLCPRRRKINRVLGKTRSGRWPGRLAPGAPVAASAPPPARPPAEPASSLLAVGADGPGGHARCLGSPTQARSGLGPACGHSPAAHLAAGRPSTETRGQRAPGRSRGARDSDLISSFWGRRRGQQIKERSPRQPFKLASFLLLLLLLLPPFFPSQHKKAPVFPLAWS